MNPHFRSNLRTWCGLRLIRLKKLLGADTPFGFMALLGAMSLAGLAITIMAGLTFGTLLTMILLLAPCSILFAVPSPARG